MQHIDVPTVHHARVQHIDVPTMHHARVQHIDVPTVHHARVQCPPCTVQGCSTFLIRNISLTFSVSIVCVCVCVYLCVCVCVCMRGCVHKQLKAVHIIVGGSNSSVSTCFSSSQQADSCVLQCPSLQAPHLHRAAGAWRRPPSHSCENVCAVYLHTQLARVPQGAGVLVRELGRLVV